MRKVCISYFGNTSCFSTLAVIINAYQHGDSTVKSYECPSLAKMLEARGMACGTRSFTDLISKIEKVHEVVGYNIVTDKEGNILSKEEITKNYFKFYLNPSAVKEIMMDLENPFNKKNMEANFRVINTVANPRG